MTKSRIEKILSNMLGASYELEEPVSRNEELLLQLIDVMLAGSNGVAYLTEAPTADNSDDGNLKIVVLESNPATRYNGYIYIITGA